MVNVLIYPSAVLCRQILLLTDGEVYNVGQLIDLVAKNASNTRYVCESKLISLAWIQNSEAIILTLRTSEAGIPALLKLPCGVGRLYTGFAQTSLWRRQPVYRRHGMSTPGVGRRYTGFVF